MRSRAGGGSLPRPRLRYRAGSWMPEAGIQEKGLDLGYQFESSQDIDATYCSRLAELTQGMHDPERMSKA